MLSLLRSFWADSLAETWGWHPMLYAVAAPQLTRGVLASPRPQAMLFNRFVVGLENMCPLSLPKSRESMIATWISRQLFSARPETLDYVKRSAEPSDKRRSNSFAAATANDSSLISASIRITGLLDPSIASNNA
ncbi:hypothetical protein Pla52n_62890 [Stieleria varia]|uniref:Uncharacterized protein n=1 Tax=Stieleria varia TaxID=2528005 RepID=A0A5C5ZZ70_9BACT|nr:hypothetical protein Pla52n_62890 [Stieleria varia]